MSFSKVAFTLSVKKAERAYDGIICQLPDQGKFTTRVTCGDRLEIYSSLGYLHAEREGYF